MPWKVLFIVVQFVRYTITASSQKINHKRDQRQPIVAVRSTYTIIAHNQIK